MCTRYNGLTINSNCSFPPNHINKITQHSFGFSINKEARELFSVSSLFLYKDFSKLVEDVNVGGDNLFCSWIGPVHLQLPFNKLSVGRHLHVKYHRSPLSPFRKWRCLNTSDVEMFVLANKQGPLMDPM